MAKADGSVVIAVGANTDEAQKKLNSLKTKIGNIEESIAGKKDRQNILLEKLESARKEAAPLLKEVDRIEKKLAGVQAITKGEVASDPLSFLQAQGEETKLVEELAAAKEKLIDVDKIADQLGKKYDALDESIRAQELSLGRYKDKAGGLEKQIAASQSGLGRFAPAMKNAEKSTDRFNRRIKEVLRSALVFSVITRAIRAMQEWLSKVVKTDAQASASVARLKGALLTLVQPLVQVIIPAFTRFVDVLTRVVTFLAAVAAQISGATLQSSSEAAESLYQQTEALESTGAAAKKASKQLAGFDEINKLSADSESGGGSSGGSSGGEIKPIFEQTQIDTSGVERFLDIVEAIGAAFLGWKIGKAFKMNLTEIGGLVMSIYFAVQFVEEIMDAWNNGVNLDNAIGAVAKLAGTAVGLTLAFGKVGGGIGLVIGGAAMLVTGIRDVIKNGVNLENTLMIIGGIVATGLGFFFLTGSVIPLVIAGVASIVYAVLALGGGLEDFVEGLKNILGGILRILKGFLTRDWKEFWEGLKMVTRGAVEVITSLFGSITRTFERVGDWLIEKIDWLLSKLFKAEDSVSGYGGGFSGQGGNSKASRSFSLVSEDVPHLARGAVIPPNREFMAVLGDQKSGTNIEAPLDTIIEAIRRAFPDGGGGWGGAGGVIQVNVMLDKRKVGEATVDVMREMERSRGW